MHDEDEKRIELSAARIVDLLSRKYGHSEEKSRSLFEAFHMHYSKMGGWAPADYYDHEGPLAVVIEIQFHHLFPTLPRSGAEFLEWRKSQWR